MCAAADATTATAAEAPVGTVLEFERTGKLKEKKGKAARQVRLVTSCPQRDP